MAKDIDLSDLLMHHQEQQGAEAKKDDDVVDADFTDVRK